MSENNQVRRFINERGQFALNRRNLRTLILVGGVKGLTYALDFALIPQVQEAVKVEPNLVPLGLAAFGLMVAASMVVRPRVLNKRGIDTGIVSSLLYNLLDFVSQRRRANAILANGADFFLGIVGTSPAAMWATYMALVSGQYELKVAERITAALLMPLHLAFNLLLLRRANQQPVANS